jgi:hypothetical protein
LDAFSATIGTLVYGLFADCQRMGIRRFEDGGSVEISQRLSPVVSALIERGAEIMATIRAHYEQEQAAPDDNLELFEEELASVPPPAPKSPAVVVCDVAFMAQAELRQHQLRLLSHRSEADAQEMISDCGGALRAIQKSLYAVEPLLCELEKIPHFLPSHLETSLQVRKHYRKLWAFALVVGDVTAESARTALRGAGTRIAMLTGSDVYSLLREDDRFYIRELQVRILAWLREGTDPLAAIRIWQDFSLFVEILRQVNLREELLRHDRDVLVRSAGLLELRGEVALEEVKRQLRAVLGVDDGLDEAILGRPPAKALLHELRRAALQLGVVLPEPASQSMAL